MSSWASQAQAFPQPVFERLSWLHHWSVPHVHSNRAFSPSWWGPDPQSQATQVVHWTWWWRLVAWHCRSVWSLPCHSAADAGGLVLSMAKSHWHRALHSAHKSCTHGHVFWKRGGVKRELVAAPWTSSRWFSHVLWLKVHSHLLLRACLLGSKRKLPPTACQVRLRLNLCGFNQGAAVPWHRVHLWSGSFVKCLSPLHFLCTQCLQLLQKMLLLPTPVQQTVHGNLPELCSRSRPIPQIMIFVFPAFTLSPFFSVASFQIKSLLTHSSSDSAMITRSLA